jgi:ADP-heptose:LPS heptosyltransferase
VAASSHSPQSSAPAAKPPSKSFRKRVCAFLNNLSDRILFPLWLVWQCARHRKKAVIICRPGALGDVICTLPLCGEIRKRHPGALLIFLTHTDYKKMVLLSRVPDEIFGAKSWTWPFALPPSYKFSGFVEAIYNPKTTDELSPNTGAQVHLIDDFAKSCGVTIPNPNRQPRLFPPAELIKAAQAKYELAEDIAKGRRVIGINCGRTWPVRMWDAAKWQALVDKIHADYDALVLQFGFTTGKEDPYEQLRGVKLLTNRLKSDELIGLIAGCHLMISIDSGPVHIAGGVGVPVVGLFGAVNPRFRLPPDSPATSVTSNVPCLGCHHTTPRGHWQSGCPYDIRCMKELDVDTVYQAVKKMLP